MVDEDAFRKELRAAAAQSCPFGKAILARCCACSLSDKHAIAERETVNCSQPSARGRCLELYGLLRRNSLFALRQLHVDDPLTHAQNMKIQCGGLLGLQFALDAATEVVDVVALVEAACHEFGSLDEFPYSRIVQSVSAFQLRKQHGKD